MSTHPFRQTNTHLLHTKQKSSGSNEKFLVHRTLKRVETQACQVREKSLHSTTGSSRNHQVQLFFLTWYRSNLWLWYWLVTVATFDIDNSPMMFQRKGQWCYWNTVQKGIELKIWRQVCIWKPSYWLQIEWTIWHQVCIWRKKPPIDFLRRSEDVGNYQFEDVSLEDAHSRLWIWNDNLSLVSSNYLDFKINWLNILVAFLSDPGKPGVRSLGPDVRPSVRDLL